MATCAGRAKGTDEVDADARARDGRDSACDDRSLRFAVATCDGNVAGEIQIDGEGNLNTEQAKNWMTGKGQGRTSKVTVTEAYNPFRNARIERKWETLKRMSRCMLSKAGLSTKYWYLAMKMAANINNVVMLVRDENGDIAKVVPVGDREWADSNGS